MLRLVNLLLLAALIGLVNSGLVNDPYGGTCSSAEGIILCGGQPADRAVLRVLAIDSANNEMEIDRDSASGGGFTLVGCLREFTPTSRVVEIVHHCGNANTQPKVLRVSIPASFFTKEGEEYNYYPMGTIDLLYAQSN